MSKAKKVEHNVDLDHLDIASLKKLISDASQRVEDLETANRSDPERRKQIRDSKQRKALQAAKADLDNHFKTAETCTFTVTLTVKKPPFLSLDGDDEANMTMTGKATGLSGAAARYVTSALEDFCQEACMDGVGAFFPKAQKKIDAACKALENYIDFAEELLGSEFYSEDEVEEAIKEPK